MGLYSHDSGKNLFLEAAGKVPPAAEKLPSLEAGAGNRLGSLSTVSLYCTFL